MATRSKQSKRRTYTPRSDLPALLREAQKLGSTRELLSHLHALRERGDGDALAVLGVVYREGLHAVDGRILIQRDSRLAKRYTDQAAAMGNPPAMTAIANDLLSSSSPISRSRAISLYKAAASRGYVAAAYNLAVSYLDDNAHRPAVAWFRHAASMGDQSSCLQLALAEFHGLGIRRNPAAAIAKLLKLARSNDGLSDIEREDSILFAAIALRQGWGVARDYSKSLVLLREAAEMGSNAAQGLLEDLGEEWE